MCDVCDTHNAYGIPDELELDDRDEDILPNCHECKRAINAYQEKVHVWRIHDHQHPCGFRSIALCDECHNIRMGNRLE